MKVLVAGGSGYIGTALSEELTERGHDVTALSRTPEDGSLPDGVEAHAGDVTDYESIEAAFEGQDAVVNLVALSPLYKPSGGDEMHMRVHLGGTKNVIRAAEEHGVRRLVQMSFIGAETDAPTYALRAKGESEQVVRDSDLEWVIVRPSVVFGEGGEFVDFVKRLKKLFAPVVPLYPLPGGGRMPRFQPIWIGDLVPMVADTVEDDEHVGESYDLCGPEKLTLREVTNMVFEAEERSITIVSLPMGLAKVGLTVLGSLGFPMGRDQYRALGADNTTNDNSVDVFGVDEGELRTFADYLGIRN